MAEPQRGVRGPALVVGILLLVVAAVVAYDGSQIGGPSTYGIGPRATPYVIAVFLALLGLGHLVTALRDGLPVPEEADPVAIAWIGVGLAALLGSVAFGGGFLVGTTLLFAATARAFGNRRLWLDLLIGIVLSVVVYLLFNRLLTLTLPEGPLERLL